MIGAAGAPRQHLRALTGIRFLAALWVLAFHAMPRMALPTPVRQFVEAGYLGVSLFFVLSGFVLTHVYEAQVAAPPFRTWTFLRARFARVYPGYSAALILAIPLFVHDTTLAGAPRGATLAGVCSATLTMTQAWIPGWGCSWNCPGWSLSVEAFFYLSFPVLAPWVLRQTDRALAVVATGAVVTLALFGALMAEDTPAVLKPAADFFQHLPLNSWTPILRLPEFVIGICSARLLRHRDGRSRLCSWWGPGAVALIVLVVLETAAWQGGLARTAALVVPSALLIAALADPTRETWLGSPLFVRLGNASYSLYLIHAFGFAYYLAIVNRVVDRSWAQGWQSFSIYLVLVVGSSLIMHDRFEVPARRLLRGQTGTLDGSPSW